MSAEFKVVKIDEFGSGMDYDGHLGSVVHDARRCCKKCSCIFAYLDDFLDDKGQPEFVLFTFGELKPLNDGARLILNEIQEDHPWAISKDESWLDGIKTFMRKVFGR